VVKRGTLPADTTGRATGSEAGVEDQVIDPRLRRVETVRRLLELGVSSRTLMAILPEWSELIAGVSTTFGPYVDRPQRR
jgi:hypothetical protein